MAESSVDYPSFWTSGLLLASFALVHSIVLRRSLSVSGRYVRLVDRLSVGRAARPMERASEAELVQALRAATEEAFGQQVLNAEVEPPQPAPDSTPARRPESWSVHLLFLVGLALGGLLSSVLGQGVSLRFGLNGALFAQTFGDSPLVTGCCLFGGGVLVGVGTRMAGGCTSSHGLCGVSQIQPGSLLAVASFLGAGVVTAFALGAWS